MSRGRVLLVEDSADDEALLLRALRTGGLAADVDVVRSGQEALRLLLGTAASANGDAPLVVLLDLQLGAVDGFTVLREVRSNPRTQLVPVVVTSASAQDEDVERAYSLGANGYVQKSVDFDRFAYDVQVAAAYWMRVNVAPRSRPAPRSLPRELRTPTGDFVLRDRRMKNDLQMISSLIEMQVRKLEDGASRDALEEWQTRVQAIALIHETLSQAKDYGRVPFPEYARSLARSVLHAAARSPARVALEMDVEDVAIEVDKAIPCGLVLNELITNALKHAFPGGRAGTIRVELRRVEGPALRLVVTDDGVGMPPDFDIQQSESLGHELITRLAEQLDGQLTIENIGGARFSLTFPGSV